MSRPYRVFKRGEGTLVAAGRRHGAWQCQLSHFGKEECLGEFDSAAEAKAKAVELLAADRSAIYLVCGENQLIIEQVFDKPSRADREERDRLVERRARLVMDVVFATAS